MQTTNIFKVMCLCAGLLAASLITTRAATITNADVPDNLNLGTSWVGGTPAGSGDVALWDSNVVANLTKSLGANLAWSGIQILNPAGTVTISAGNTLTLGASGIDMSLATNSLTLANSNILSAAQTWNVTNGMTLTASGGISGGGTALLTVNGGGTVALNGASSYSGGTVINNGVLRIGVGTGAGTGAITNNNGTTLRVATTTSIVNNPNFNGAVTIDLNATAGNQGLTGAWSGGGTVTFVNQDPANRIMTIGGGTSGSMAGFTGTVSFGTNNGTFRFNDGGSSPNLGNALATFDLGTGSATNYTRTRNVTVSLGALTGGPNTRITTGTSGSGTTVYSIGGNNSSTIFNGKIGDGGTANAVAVTKVGAGVLTLAGANTYAGATTISAGTLQVDNGGTTGALGSAPIVNNATLVYDRSDTPTVVNAISGSGNIIQIGGNLLTFSGTNSSSGTLIVSNGTVILGATGSILCPVSVLGGATFDVSQKPTFTLNQTLSGSGVVTGALVAVGGTISPGGSGQAATLNFSNGVTESGNVNNQMELSSVGSTNDLINITGDLTISGINNITLSHFGGGVIPSGTYPLITYSGNFNGGITNFAAVPPGGNSAILTNNPANTISVIIGVAGRSATNLTWTGDGGANNWALGSVSNWINGANYFAFQTGDSVRFDGVGSSNPVVNLATTVLPSAVVVSNTTAYTITGEGSISGSTGLTKTNSGTLSLLTTNSYTGPTIIGGGTLVVSYLANGAVNSDIGASGSDPSNLVFYSSTLNYTGPNTSTDHGATLNGSGGTFDIIGGRTLAVGGNITGGGALTLIDTGTLNLPNPNTYAGGTVLSNGVLALGSNNANNDGSGGSAVGATNKPVTFYGGTLQLFGYTGSTSSTFNNFYNPLVVPAGQTGTLQMFPRGNPNTGAGAGLNSSLSGGGTLNLVVDYVRGPLSGDWSAFTGTINVTPKPSGQGDEFRINNNSGYANAAIYINGVLTMDSTLSSNATINIGELGGIYTATIGAGNSTLPNPTWVVGSKNTTNLFAGTIANDGVTSIVKVGTGMWILSGVNTYTGSTTISNGVLALTNNPDLSADGSIGGSTNIFINAGAILDVSGNSNPTLTLGAAQNIGGSGTLNGSLDSQSGATITPGIGASGTLKVTNTIAFGGSINIAVDHIVSAATNSSLAAASITIPSGATLNVIQGTNDLVTGDTFKLFIIGDASVSALGSLTVNLPATSPDSLYTYVWDTSQLNVNGTIILTSGAPATSPAPVASFSVVGPTNIFFVTQPVAFTNTSTGSYTNATWRFGDGNTATNSGANVTNTYASANTYQVILTVSGAGGVSSATNNVVVIAKPSFGKPVLSNGSLILSGSNGVPYAPYRIWTSTNVATSIASWTVATSASFDSNGAYNYTNTPLTNKASFFRLSSP